MQLAAGPAARGPRCAASRPNLVRSLSRLLRSAQDARRRVAPRSDAPNRTQGPGRRARRASAHHGAHPPRTAPACMPMGCTLARWRSMSRRAVPQGDAGGARADAPGALSGRRAPAHRIQHVNSYAIVICLEGLLISPACFPARVVRLVRAGRPAAMSAQVACRAGRGRFSRVAADDAPARQNGASERTERAERAPPSENGSGGLPSFARDPAGRRVSSTKNRSHKGRFRGMDADKDLSDDQVGGPPCTSARLHRSRHTPLSRSSPLRPAAARRLAHTPPCSLACRSASVTAVRAPPPR